MKFIQVGVGGFGAGWVERIVADATASHVALVDINEEALDRARRLTDIPAEKCYADYHAAFEQVEADAVLCVTPPAVHHEVALAAFARGMHVLTEKPLADSMAQARQMVGAAETAGKTLMVSQNYRFHPWIRTIQRLLDSAQFGPPDNILVRFAKAPRFEGSFRLKMEHPLVYDMSIHHFDMMRALTGREPLSVYAETWRPRWSWFDHDPCCVAVFQFEGDLRVVYHGSWVARGPETSWGAYWQAECPDAIVELRDDQVHMVFADHPEQDTEVEMLKMPASGQEYSLFEFQRAIQQKREPETNGRDNLRSLAMVFAVTQSAREGRPVSIESVLEA